MRAASSVVALLVLLSLPASLGAETLRFDDASHAPADSLQIGPVTISANQPGGVFQPNTTLGLGLGVAGPVGQTWSFDQQLSYEVGESFPSTTLREDRIRFTLDPDENLSFSSLLILPYLTISGPGAPYADLPAYGFSIFVGLPFTGGGGVQIPTSALGQPTVIDLPYEIFLNNNQSIHTIELFLSTGMGSVDEGIFFSEFRDAYLDEAQTIQFGFTLISLDFEPIPEPSSFALLGLGALLLMLRRERSRLGAV